MRQRTQEPSQRGSALIVALVLLVVVTLISITAMQTSTMELRMAGNEQEYKIGLDAVESATNMAIHSDQLVIGANDTTSCFFFGAQGDTTDCDTVQELDAGGGISTVANNNVVRVTVAGTAGCPPGMATSLTLQRHNVVDDGSSGGSCAYLRAVSSYDRTGQMGSRVETEQGFVRFLPGT